MARVLIVNDEQDLADLCRLVLERRGFDVHTRMTSDGLPTLVEELRPDVIVLDWFVGDTTADRVLPALRRAMPSAAILVMSASRSGPPPHAISERRASSASRSTPPGSLAK